MPNPKKNARVALKSAVDSGRIKREPCEVCGEPKSEGHHEDYAKPLEVNWLCKRHHTEKHFPNGKIKYKTCKISEDTLCGARVESKRSGRSLSWIFSEAIRQYLKVHGWEGRDS